MYDVQREDLATVVPCTHSSSSCLGCCLSCLVVLLAHLFQAFHVAPTGPLQLLMGSIPCLGRRQLGQQLLDAAVPAMPVFPSILEKLFPAAGP